MRKPTSPFQREVARNISTARAPIGALCPTRIIRTFAALRRAITRAAMAAAAAMQRKAVGLAAILVAILTVRLCGLRRQPA